MADPSVSPAPRPTAPTAAPASADEIAAANMRGILAMVASMACFICSDTLSKSASPDITAGQIMAIRGVFATAILVPMVLLTSGFSAIWRRFSTPWALRTVGETGGAIFFLTGLVHLPIANVTAITQTAPLVLTAAGALLLGEHVGWRRWLATLAGFLGVLLIVRPGTAHFSWWSMSVLTAVLFVCLRDLATRRIATAVPSILVTFVTAAAIMVAGFALYGIETWQPLPTRAIVHLAIAAFFIIGGYHFAIVAMRHGELATVAPFRYSIILWALVIGYLVFDEVPDALGLAGMLVVTGAGVYTFLREQRARRRV